MNIKKIRNKIDKLDNKIVKLIATRLELGLLTRAYKTTSLDTERETEVLNNVSKAACDNDIDSQFIKNLYIIIMDKSKDMQESQAKNKSKN